MSEFSWTPGLIVLAAGIAGGLYLAWRLRSPGKAAAKRQRTQDLELEIKDLEGRRDDLYRRLRDEAGHLSDSERRELETAAARVLRDLDAVSGKAGGRAKGGGSKQPAERSGSKRDSAPEESSPYQKRPLLTGFLLGAGMVAIVGVLVYWAVRDTAGTEVPSEGSAEEAHQDLDLTLQAQAEYDALQRQLGQNPADVGARKRLAVLLLSEEQYFAAFREAQTLLAMDPQDLDGLYVEAVVRLQMGQSDQALERLNEVLFLYPDHVQALAWKGILLYQTGDRPGAIASWERGIEAAGGQHPELEEMVTAALAEGAGVEPEEARAPAEEPTASQAPAAAAATSAAGEEAGEAGIQVRIELAEGVESPGGVLFVALRTAEGAPPVAVRRIDQPRFPLDVPLSESDSMMGGALPESGVLTVRLDQDGDVSSPQAGDLTGRADAALGSSSLVVLRP